MFSPGWESRLQALPNLPYTLFPTRWLSHHFWNTLYMTQSSIFPLHRKAKKWPCLQAAWCDSWRRPVVDYPEEKEINGIQIGKCREQGIKKVEKCLQTRLSTRAEHSCKRDVQLRILFVPMGKEHFLHTRMFLWFLKKNRPRDKTDSKLIRKFPKTKS